jgi:hypothetical protein
MWLVFGNVEALESSLMKCDIVTPSRSLKARFSFCWGEKTDRDVTERGYGKKALHG